MRHAASSAPLTTQPKEESGEVYRLTRRLDRHAPLLVFRARTVNDRGPGCYVLKTIGGPRGGGIVETAPQLAGKLAMAQLRREAEVAQQVTHPNLTVLLDARWERRPYLLFPYREGVSLRGILSWRGGRARDTSCGLPLPWVLGVFRQAAAALAALHRAGWLHGQVRPEHILVHPTGYACLIDLTAARRLESAECTASGGCPPAAWYAAPEWGVARQLVTAAADVYALGCVLWECLTGQPPFAASSGAEVMRLHLRAALPELRSMRPDVPWELAAGVRQMLAKEPLRRPTACTVERWLAETAVEVLASLG